MRKNRAFDVFALQYDLPAHFFVPFCRKLTEYQVTNDGANIQIVLDRAGQIFTNGSEVSGHVVITANEPLSYDQIIVSLKGEGKVFFPLNHGKLARMEENKYILSMPVTIMVRCTAPDLKFCSTTEIN